tara:strand:+ start:1023 stop:2906 length:1884 start_codon:yes stop_codon:yes gene_type:complete
MNKINVSLTQMRKIRSLLGEEEEENLFFDRFAPEPAAELGEGQGIGSTALQNLPYSAAERFREVEEAARDPAGLLKGLGNLAVGTGDVFAEKFGADPTERGQMARQAGQKFLSDFEAENFARDPLAPVSNVLGVLAPFSPLGKGAMGRAALSADLPGLALATGARAAKTGGRTLLAAGKKTGELGGRAAAHVPGFLTGVGAKRVIGAFEAGHESPKAKELAIAQMTRTFSHKDIGGAVGKEIQKVVDKLGGEEADALNAAGDQLFNILPIKADLVGNVQNRGADGILRKSDIIVSKSNRYDGDVVLKEGNMRLSLDLNFPPAIIGTDDVKILRFLERFLEAPNSMTAKDLHGYKRQLDKINPVSNDGGRIIGSIRKPIRDGLRDVKGYDKPTEELHEFLEFIEELEEDVGKMRVSGRERLQRTELGKRLGQAFEHKGDEIFDVMDLLDERFPDLHLKSKLAAQGMSGIEPTGLVGRAEVAGSARALGGFVAGAGAAAALGAGIPEAILGGVVTLAFSSPKVVARGAIELGASARVAKTVAERIERLWSRADFLKIPESTLRGLTVAQVINRITQEENRGNLQMGGGRRSVPVWDATQTPYSRNAQGQGASSDSTIEQPSFLGQFAPR